MNIECSNIFFLSSRILFHSGWLEDILKKTHEAGAREIFDTIAEDVLRFNPVSDDILFVVIKKK